MILLVVLVSLVLFWLSQQKRRKINVPPGPFQFPVVGNLPQIAAADSIGHVALDKLSKKYGDLMYLRVGSIDTVVVATYEAAKDLCMRDETLDRQCDGAWWDRNLKQDIGLAFCTKPVWLEMVKFCRNSMRDYGFGKREAMENLVTEEIDEFVKTVDEDRQNSPNGRIKFHTKYFSPTFTNLNSTLVLGKKFRRDDPLFLDLLKYSDDFIRHGLLGISLLGALPFLKQVLPGPLHYYDMMAAIKGLHQVAASILNERRKEDYLHNPRCLTDDFLRKIDEDANNPKPLFTEDSYKIVFADFMQAGSETTGNLVNFIILLLSAHPQIQEKLYEEIVQVIGIDALPSLDHKQRMPYTSAVLLEGHRWGRILVHGVPKKISEDFEYRGYTLKKGWVILMNLQSIFFDEEFWGDPNVFRPERFLDENGELLTSKTERIISFGLGKRNCFGEVLARDSSFLFLTTLVQKFEFKKPEGVTYDLEPKVGVTMGPSDYEAIVNLRHH